MGDKEENDSKEKEIPRTSQDGGFQTPDALTEGNLLSISSNKNTENSSTISENMPRAAAIEGSGDNAGRNVQENSKLDKIEAELTEMSKDINIDAGKGSGDYTTKAKVSVIDDKIIEDINSETNAKASNTDIISVSNGSNDDLLDKCDYIDLEKAEDPDDDDDMKLRWDEDDDTITQSLNDDNANIDDKNDGILTEDQLLEDSSDVPTEKGNLESVTHIESETSPKLQTDKADHEKCLEDKLLEKPDDNTEAIKSPEMVLSSEEEEDSEMNSETGCIAQTKEIIDMKSKDEQYTKSAEKQTCKESVDNIIRLHKIYELAKSDYEARKIMPSSSNDVLSKDNLLEDSEINSKPEFIAFAKQIVDFCESMDERVKQAKSPEKLLTEKELLNLLKQATLLTKSECLSKENCLDSDYEGKFSEGKLSEMWHSDAFRQHIIELRRAGVLSSNREKEFPMNKELDDDVLLEEKLLEESETAEVIPESDVTMEVDEENEEELLKDHGEQNDICNPMDVDITDPFTEDQSKIEDKIVDQPMDDESEIEKIEVVQTNVEQTDVDQTAEEIKVMDESDTQLQITEKIIDQPVEDTSKTVEVIKDIPAVENTETVESNKETAIEDQAKKDGKNTKLAVSEMENVNQQMDDEKKMDENSKDQLSAKTHTTKESIKTSEPSDTLAVSNIEIEGQQKSIPDKSTLEKVIESKKEQEKPKLQTESLHDNIHFEKLENSKEISVLDSSDKKNVTAELGEISASSSSIFRDSLSPIKSFHGVNKADVMLEIPTQELIDMDMTDLSMNLDHSEDLDGDENMEKESEDDKTNDKSIADDDKVTEKSLDDIAKVVDATANQNVVAQNKVTETHSDKSTDENDSANKKSVDQQTTLLLLQLLETTVDKVATESKIVESGKKDETVVEATIEENMEKMFADDEPEVTKEVPECIASTSQTLDQPSTSTTHMTPDTSDEVPDVSDSLGLLAESTRRIEDDEENEYDDDGGDDDDFDQDESSNQVSAEQSEDSNPAAVESEPVAEPENKELGTENKELETEIKELKTPDPKESEFPFLRESYAHDKGQKVHMGFGTMDLQAETISEMNEEATSAVAALLNSGNPEIEQAKAPEKSPKDAPEVMDIETVKLSDTSDNEADVELTMVEKTEGESNKEVEDKQKQSPAKSPSKSPLESKQVSPKGSPSKQIQSASNQSPSKMKNLAIATQVARSVVNIVDLEESSSSDDDVQETEVQKKQPPEPETKDGKPGSPDPDSKVTSVNIPTGIDIMCTSGGTTSEITTKDGEAVISGVPKPPRHKPARLNTSEVSIKTVSSSEPMVIPETTINEQTSTQPKPNLSLEIFSLDSDEEDSSTKATEQEEPREKSKCINYNCTSDNNVPYRVADTAEKAYYGASKKRRAQVCRTCSDVVTDRTKGLIQGLKNLTPLLDLDMRKSSQDLVEISDSDSDDEMNSEEPKEVLGKKGAKIIEDSLSQFLNDTWKKYNMDARLKETQIMLDDEIEKLEQDSKEIDEMLNACQVATDKLRCDLYATFECRRQQLPPIVIQDTPEMKYIGQEEEFIPPVITESAATRHAKRRLSSTTIDLVPAKRPAIPLGYAPLDSVDAGEKAAIPAPESKLDDDKDISVVKLSAEAAPADLPPPGEISRPPLRVGMPVYAMKNEFGPWLKGKVLEMQPKNPGLGQTFSLCRVRFDHKAKSNGKVLPARSIAYSEPADVRMTIGTRLIALFKDSNKRESYYSGVVAEIPNPVNNYRYLVFFDDGYAQYVQHQYTRLVCESSALVWEEVHPLSREFVRAYLLAYPERPMVRLHTGQNLKTEWNGKWWASRVTRVDASLAQVMFVEDGRREWIYRGSTRLAPLYLELRAAERHRPRPMPRSKAQPRLNMPYVEYIRSDEPESSKPTEAQVQVQQQMQQQQQQRDEEIRRQRAVAKKSTSAPQPYPPSHQVMPPVNTDPVTSRVVYYTPKNAVRPLKMVPHRCTPKCKRSDVLSLKELRTYNPLAKPLLSGWERQIVRFKGHKDVMYRAPCGRRIRNMRELHHYLRSIDSDLPVDLFDFHYSTHCLAEFVLNKCLVGKKDLSHGKENVPVPCVNYYDDSLPEFCSYNTERTPTAGVPLNLEPEFLCGCDCTDDCQDKSKCACWKMTLEGARTIGLRGPNVGYVYKRLPEPLPSGIYECNSRCKCKHTCLNRVAQHPLQLKLQVFKTPNRGWGIRALNDVPKGSFLCVYAGNLLTDATANLDGLNEGDEYLAELDYIEVVEQMKEGYEEDIPEADKKLDKKEQGKDGEDTEEEPSSSSEDEGTGSKTDKEDDDFRPGYIALEGGAGVAEFNKRLRRREKSKKDKENAAADDKEKDTTKDNKETKEGNAEEDCITISDDEEVREPARFMAQTNMGANEYISKYKSVRTLFGKDEACYIMDAKVQGNIGRYLNHSCQPNVFVQNVFVDTHDPRFPWVAFFALSLIKAGTELTWNYNYDVGSVPGKVLYCYCGAVNCRGRLL